MMMMTSLRRSVVALLAAAVLGCASAPSPSASAPASSATARPAHRPRVVVTPDPELHGSNSLLRYVLYRTDFRTEGIIYASSQFHWKGDGKGTLCSVPDREYFRFGQKLCPCTSWRWTPGERF